MLASARRLTVLLALVTLSTIVPSVGASVAAASPRGTAHRAARAATPLRSFLSANRLERLHEAARPIDTPSLATTPATPATPATPSVLSSFAGVADGNPDASPSDSTGAAGPDFFVGAANVHVQVFDRSGISQAGPFRLKKLFNGLPRGTTDTDPKVAYDGYSGRFILVYLVYNSNEDYIVITTIPEATADQKATWCHWVYRGDQTSGDGHQFADYPGLGFTASHVTITTNNFSYSGSSYDTAQIMTFKKSALYRADCSGTPTPKVFANKATRDPDGSKAFTIQPAQTIGGTNPTTQYMASFDWNPSRASDLVLWRIRFRRSHAKLSKTGMRVRKVEFPPYGTQCGGSATRRDTLWDPGDLRLTGSFYDADGGRLYTANAIAHRFGTGSTRSAVRWYEVDPAPIISNSSMTRNGFVGRAGYDAGWPSVATDANGVLFVNFSEASSRNHECLSFDTATIPPGGTASDGPVVVKAGEDRYQFSQGPERWGDYSAINRDPADVTGQTMAAFNAYAYNPTTQTTTPLWNEWVALLDDV
jgi:hypothetical protein